MTPRLAVVVVAHGRRELVDGALRSVARHTDVVHETIVVDNASPDDTADWVARHHPDVRLLRAGRNLGFGGGADLGAASTAAPFLCLLNSDAEVPPRWASTLLAALDAEPGWAAVSPLLVDVDGRVEEAGQVVDADGFTFLAHHGDDPADVPTGRRAVPLVSAAALMVRASAFADVGGFDPAFGLGYYEDVDLQLRLAARGWRVGVVPDVVVRHVGNASSSPERVQRLLARNRLRLASRHPSALRHRPSVQGWERLPSRRKAALEGLSGGLPR